MRFKALRLGVNPANLLRYAASAVLLAVLQSARFRVSATYILRRLPVLATHTLEIDRQEVLACHRYMLPLEFYPQRCK